MAFVDGVKRILRMCGHAFTSTVHDRLDTMEQRQAETDNVLLRASIRLAEEVRRSGRYEVLASEDPQTFHPALALLRYLFPMVPAQGARVIGECQRDIDWKEQLGAIGYCVRDPVEGELGVVRACGPLDAILPEVQNLRSALVVADLEAAGRGQAMKTMGYYWYIVLEQPSGTGEAARFYTNYPVILPQWHGTTIFFREHATFLSALQWCQAVLREVYFGPAEESK